MRCSHSLTFLMAFTILGASAMADHRSDEIIVKYKEGSRRGRIEMNEIYASANVVKVRRFQGSRRLEQLTIAGDESLARAIQALRQNPLVEFAEPNAILKVLPVADPGNVENNPPGGIPCIPGVELPGCTPLPCLFPNFPPGCRDDGETPQPPSPPPSPPAPTPPPGNNRPPVADKPADTEPAVADPELSQAYGMTMIGAVEAWKTWRGSQDVVIAVIDTGVDYNHEDLGFNMWRNPAPTKDDLVGYDFFHDDGLPFDDHSHGTHCAGNTGAVGGNGKGISGASQRVSIMAIKFLDAQGSGDEASAIRAIDYAVEHGAKILSNSWGGSGDEDVKGLKDAVARAEAKGVLFVAAAGNESSNNDTTPEFPAGFNVPNVLAVAATDARDNLAFFSNYGKNTVHVAAPGVGIYSTVPGNKYEKMSGTSMACPLAAGAAALLWSAHPEMTYKDVKSRLMDSVDAIPSLAEKTISGGRINVMKALR